MPPGAHLTAGKRGQTFFACRIKIRAGADQRRNIYQRQIVIFNQVCDHAIREHVTILLTLGRRVAQSGVLQFARVRADICCCVWANRLTGDSVNKARARSAESIFRFFMITAYLLRVA